MKELQEKTTYFFVDESGDPTFYNRKGEYVVGSEGCSPILLLGFIKTEDPVSIRQRVAALRKEILSDNYLNTVLSVRNRTAIAFHATDDIPEVRERVYRLIKDLPLKAEFIVARKIEDIFIKRHNSSANIFYDDLVTRLFKSQLHQSHRNIIYFAVRGNRARQKPLEEAIKTAINLFEEESKTELETEVKILPQRPESETCLQVVDYLNWAVYRAFTKREERYLRFVENKISLIVDLYDSNTHHRNYYNARNPFSVERISPL